MCIKLRKAAPPQSPHPARQIAPLGVFDFTLLVVGAIIGADIYVVAGLGARSLGPAQLVAWVVAGVLATLISLAFVQCAAICPQVGGSYAYARAAFGPLVGFLAGWSLYLGEWVALPVFPLAFVNYLGTFVPAHSPMIGLLARLSLITAITGANLVGARASSRLNDVLTLAKLTPLALLVGGAVVFGIAHSTTASSHLRPFTPLGWQGFGVATVLIFWAYAGFELAPLPAADVRDPARTLPRGLIIGMAISICTYLLVAVAVVVSLPWQQAAASNRPLDEAARAILTGLNAPSSWGPVLMSLGALISIAGVYDVFTLSVSRLSYALARDGLFPSPFAYLHHRFGTPWAGLVFQAGAALLLSFVGNLSSLIGLAVFFLGVCYLLTAFAALQLVASTPGQALHIPGLRLVLVLAIVGSIYLITQESVSNLLIGGLALIVGLLAYIIREQDWREAAALLRLLERDKQQLWLMAERPEHWLLRFLRRRRAE